MTKTTLALVGTLVALATCTLAGGQAHAQPCEEPNMMITLDKSGSMAGTKWTQAQQAVAYVVNNYSAQFRFGLTLYPSNGSCARGVVNVDLGGNEPSIVTTVNNTTAVGGTPIAATLMQLNQYRLLKDVNRRNFIMLITDGEEYCAALPGEAVSQAATLLAGGVRTYVIGFGTGVDAASLNNIAQAGGTDRGNDGVAPYYYQADTGQLQAVMQEILADALVESCDDRDNDCDGLVDEPWPLKNTLCTLQQGQCTFPGVWKCNPTHDGLVCDAQVQTSPEVCDGFDNDCDGQVDEGFPDADGDGYNNCVDCNDGNPQVHPNQTEVCNTLDDDCDGAVDESDPQLGAVCGASDVGECSRGTLQCQDGSLACVGEIGPSPEVCDNRDNNCVGGVDENLSRPCVTQCGTGQQVCQAGVWGACSVPNPTPELCDGLDNDCDGQTDEDFEPLLGSPCEAGLGVCHVTGTYVCAPDRLQVVCSASPPAGGLEECNTLDDDCDGAVDESDPQLGLPCGVCTVGELPPCYIDEGDCEPGMWFCVDGALQCLGEVERGTEVCDGRDNDCDGLTDENAVPEICDDGLDNDCDGLVDAYDPDCGTACTPGEREACGQDEGDCELGVRVCDPSGAWGPCEGAIDPVPEVCDGRDNDCDGEIDEDAVPEICDNGIDDDCDGLVDGQDPDCGECTPGEQRVCGSDVGECQPGRQLCNAYGSWGVCAGTVDPEPERCDGLDNDCDGLVDEGSLCEGFEVCLCGRCSDRCAAGECPAGNLVCRNDFCVEDPCCGLRCEPGLECEQGACVDRCVIDQVQCQAPDICRLGLCVPPDCYHPEHACPAGELCLEGACQADPCAQTSCPPGEYCREGQCLALACQDCSADQLCQAGQCVDSPCAGVTCPGGRLCVGGVCAADPCEGVYCPQGTLCADGQCQGDPCEAVSCPDESLCSQGFCVPAGGSDGGTDGGLDGADGADGEADAGADGADAGPDGADAADGGADGGADDLPGDEPSGCGCGAARAPGSLAGLFLGLLGLAAWRRRAR